MMNSTHPHGQHAHVNDHAGQHYMNTPIYANMGSLSSVCVKVIGKRLTYTKMRINTSTYTNMGIKWSEIDTRPDAPRFKKSEPAPPDHKNSVHVHIKHLLTNRYDRKAQSINAQSDKHNCNGINVSFDVLNIIKVIRQIIITK